MDAGPFKGLLPQEARFPVQRETSLAQPETSPVWYRAMALALTMDSEGVYAAGSSTSGRRPRRGVRGAMTVFEVARSRTRED
jgi:hypothetical protein